MGLATLPFPGSDFRIEHETNPLIEPAPDGLVPGLGASRGDLGGGGPFSGAYDADNAAGLLPGVGASRGDITSGDSFDFAPVDTPLTQMQEALTPGVGVNRGDLMAGEFGAATDPGFEPLSDGGNDIIDWLAPDLLSTMAGGESCGV